MTHVGTVYDTAITRLTVGGYTLAEMDGAVRVSDPSQNTVHLYRA